MSDTLSARPIEGRSFIRTKSLLRARIALDGASVVDCTIRNFSARGARLLIGDYVPLSDPFELTVVQSDKVYRANVVWRSPQAAGVSFAPSRSEGDEDIRALERENERLRTILLDLSARIGQANAEADRSGV